MPRRQDDDASANDRSHKSQNQKKPRFRQMISRYRSRRAREALTSTRGGGAAAGGTNSGGGGGGSVSSAPVSAPSYGFAASESSGEYGDEQHGAGRSVEGNAAANNDQHSVAADPDSGRIFQRARRNTISNTSTVRPTEADVPYQSTTSNSIPDTDRTRNPGQTNANTSTTNTNINTTSHAAAANVPGRSATAATDATSNNDNNDDDPIHPVEELSASIPMHSLTVSPQNDAEEEIRRQQVRRLLQKVQRQQQPPGNLVNRTDTGPDAVFPVTNPAASLGDDDHGPLKLDVPSPLLPGIDDTEEKEEERPAGAFADFIAKKKRNSEDEKDEKRSSSSSSPEHSGFGMIEVKVPALDASVITGLTTRSAVDTAWPNVRRRQQQRSEADEASDLTDEALAQSIFETEKLLLKESLRQSAEDEALAKRMQTELDRSSSLNDAVLSPSEREERRRMSDLDGQFASRLKAIEEINHQRLQRQQQKQEEIDAAVALAQQEPETVRIDSQTRLSTIEAEERERQIRLDEELARLEADRDKAQHELLQKAVVHDEEIARAVNAKEEAEAQKLVDQGGSAKPPPQQPCTIERLSMPQGLVSSTTNAIREANLQSAGCAMKVITDAQDSALLLKCAVCHEAYVLGDHIRFLPCSHTGHTKCIDVWLISNGTCPVDHRTFL